MRSGYIRSPGTIFAICLLPFAISLAADKSANPKAIIQTSAGDLTCELYQDKAPRAVGNFVNLAEGRQKWVDQKSKTVKEGVPLYDGTIFHRVIPGFMIQGGDPTGTGNGQIGYNLKDEFASDLKFDRAGRLAYANSGPNTSASQFFITEEPYPAGDVCMSDKGCDRGGSRVPKGSGYIIFGQCDMRSVELVKWIAKAGRDMETNRPIRPVVIKHVQIVRPEK